MIGEEVIIEIDITLDRLIQNAETIQGVELNALSEVEIDAFQKTQESLLHHFLHMDQQLKERQKSPLRSSKRLKIQEKFQKFEGLKKEFIHSLQNRRGRLKGV